MASLMKFLGFMIVCVWCLLFFGYTSAAADSVILSPWTEVSKLEIKLANQRSFYRDGFLFVLGGSTNDDFSVVFRSSVLGGGLLSPWVSRSELPYSTYFHSIALDNDFLYLLGGTQYPPTTSINYAYRGDVSTPGIISDWVRISDLPHNLSQASAIYFKGRIFVSGGYSETSSGFVFFDDLIASDFDSNNNLTGWDVVKKLRIPVLSHAMFGYGDYLYIIGGRDSDFRPLSNVYRVRVSDDGTLGDWET